MKKISEMGYEERLDWACGYVIIGIGKGEFRSALNIVLLAITKDAYDRGCASVQPARRRKSKGAKPHISV